MASLASGKWTPRSDQERVAIQEQLERILVHPAFKNSSRCLNFLRYIVEKTIRGETDCIKERTLGIEVFGREVEYDMGQDHVVRAAAAEVRKRIAQYYQEPGHEEEIKIQLRAGSYVPEFQLPASPASVSPPAPRPAAIPLVEAPRRTHRSVLIVIVATAALVLASSGLIWLVPHRSATALDRFWSPIVDSPQRTLICVLATPPARENQTTATHFSPPPVVSPLGIPFVSLPDALTLMKITNLLQSKGAKYEVQSETFENLPDNAVLPSFAELRNGPVVLIGNSDWSLRLMSSLRFHQASDNAANLHFIEDRQNPSSRSWSVPIDLPYPKYTEDYAIISRVLDPTTGRTVVSAAGIGLHGTAAAGEFLSDPAYMNAVAAQNGSEWRNKNVQIVISTKIIGETWGPPQVLARYFW
jgi:hypothetical protein